MQQKVFQDKEKLYYLLAGGVFFIGIILLIYFLYAAKNKPGAQVAEESMATTTVSEIVPCIQRNNLTGDCVTGDQDANPALFGVMIENYISSRPQAGIAEAHVVYEAPVEGNITRFLAIFDETQEVKQAGPVRSARPYYLDWISEYPGAMYMHVGGSPEALQKINTFDLFDVNEFFRGVYFWRDENADAPHNVFTSSQLWKSAYERFADKSISRSFESWSFSDATSTCGIACVTHIEIPFLKPSYNVVWKYVPETQIYDRFHNAIPHTDKQGNQVQASTVVVQHVTDKILDDVGRRALGTIGTGKAEVYVRGEKISGTWKKESRTARTKFLDMEGKEIAFAAGHIWIEVVPIQIEVKDSSASLGMTN